MARYGPPVALTLDMQAGEVGADLRLSSEEQDYWNRVYASRPLGSSVTVEDAAAVQQYGTATRNIELNLYFDQELEGAAQWELALGAAQEQKVSAITVPLHTARHLAAAWLACMEGSRFQVLNPPSQSGMVLLDQIITGATETYGGSRRWTVTISGAPAAPWLVPLADGTARAGAATTRLEESLPAGAMQVWAVSTAPDRPWTTDPAHFPMEVSIGGEVVRLSGIVGDTWSQQLIIAARGLNGVTRSWPTGTRVTVEPTRHAGR